MHRTISHRKDLVLDRAATGKFGRSVERRQPGPGLCRASPSAKFAPGAVIGWRLTTPPFRRISCAQSLVAPVTAAVAVAQERTRHGIADSCAKYRRWGRPITRVQSGDSAAGGTTREEAGETPQAQTATQQSDATGMRQLSQAQGALHRRAYAVSKLCRPRCYLCVLNGSEGSLQRVRLVSSITCYCESLTQAQGYAEERGTRCLTEGFVSPC